MLINPPFSKKLPGSFWGITTFFNPTGYNNKIKNYRLFRQSSKKQGLNLIAVELAFGNSLFELTPDDAEILIQLRGNEKNIMWQKEALLNVGLKALPVDCDKVAWVDCDILFKNDLWIQETSKLLEEYVVVQPFSFVTQLPKGTLDMGKEEIKELEALPYGFKKGQKDLGFAYHYINTGILTGNTGFAWAMRKDIIKKHSFYSKLLLGSSDFIMADLFCGFFQENLRWYLVNDKIYSHYIQWANEVHKDTQGSLRFTQGDILHLWHGNLNDRMYLFRAKILGSLRYDPSCDAQLSPDGLLEWASDKPDLHQAVKEYFQFRNEEGKNILTSLIFDEISNNIQKINEIKGSRAYKIANALLNVLDQKNKK